MRAIATAVGLVAAFVSGSALAGTPGIAPDADAGCEVTPWLTASPPPPPPDETGTGWRVSGDDRFTVIEPGDRGDDLVPVGVPRGADGWMDGIWITALGGGGRLALEDETRFAGGLQAGIQRESWAAGVTALVVEGGDEEIYVGVGPRLKVSSAPPVVAWASYDAARFGDAGVTLAQTRAGVDMGFTALSISAWGATGVGGDETLDEGEPGEVTFEPADQAHLEVRAPLGDFAEASLSGGWIGGDVDEAAGTAMVRVPLTSRIRLDLTASRTGGDGPTWVGAGVTWVPSGWTPSTGSMPDYRPPDRSTFVASVESTGSPAPCPPPVITFFFPADGPSAGGGTIEIEGDNIDRVTTITMDGVPVPFTHTFIGVVEVLIVDPVPPHAPGDVELRILSPCGADSAVYTYTP